MTRLKHENELWGVGFHWCWNRKYSWNDHVNKCLVSLQYSGLVCWGTSGSSVFLPVSCSWDDEHLLASRLLGLLTPTRQQLPGYWSKPIKTLQCREAKTHHRWKNQWKDAEGKMGGATSVPESSSITRLSWCQGSGSGSGPERLISVTSARPPTSVYSQPAEPIKDAHTRPQSDIHS